MFSLTATVASILLLGIPAQDSSGPPQTTAGSVPSQTVEDVVVVGERDLSKAVDGFIAEVAAPVSRQGLAVWNREVCVGTANFRQEHAHFLIDRISQVASHVGLEPGGPGCKPDVMIIGTTEASVVATSLVDKNALAFRPALAGTDLGSAALDRFKSVDRAVRWWNVSMAVGIDSGSNAVQLIGDNAPPEIEVRVASRAFTSAVRQDLKRVVVIVDLDRLGLASFAQLADYIAMVTLAQIDMEADATSYRTVLNLFAPGAMPSGLTQWDVDYLKALYAAPVDRRLPRHQRVAIADAMVQARQAETAPR